MDFFKYFCKVIAKILRTRFEAKGSHTHIFSKCGCVRKNQYPPPCAHTRPGRTGVASLGKLIRIFDIAVFVKFPNYISRQKNYFLLFYLFIFIILYLYIFFIFLYFLVSLLGPFKCRKCRCPRVFEYSENRRRHEREDHEGKKVTTCEVCGKELKTYRILQQHLKIHDDEVFECPVCKKIFAHERSMKRHLKTHE